MRLLPRHQLQEEESGTFSYRPSRTRMVVECCFLSIVTKFRLLGKAVDKNAENAIDRGSPPAARGTL